MFILRFLKFLLKIIAKFIRWILRSVVKIVVVVLLIASLLSIGSYVLVRERFEFDPYDTVKYSYVLAEAVDEVALCPNIFNADDMTQVQELVNLSVSDMITFTDEAGYAIKFDELPQMSADIKLSDKQLGALAQKTIEQETQGIIQAGDFALGYQLLQIDISNVKYGDADFNCIVKLDMTSIKESLVAFPASYLKGVLPDVVYVSSTVAFEKGETGFDYTLSHRSFTVNNLDEFQTEDMFRMLDVALGIGSSKELNIQISQALFGVLIGGETQRGFVYSLKDYGASGFEFVEEDGVQYMVVVKNTQPEPPLPPENPPVE
ncbi:MAG: hypothetical protein J6R83_04565 [Clostridia bacterium]|nr:hypothetical protein [Clostridia bacterium]